MTREPIPLDPGTHGAATDGKASPPEVQAHALAPRPRPGFRSRTHGQRDENPLDKAQLFAGVLRAGLGVVGLFGALLYLPVQPATPVLSGVSLLMMVTGSTSTWRTVRHTPALKKLPLAVAGLCAVATLLTMCLTWILGAGSLGPVAAARAAAAASAKTSAEDASATIRFEPGP